MHSGPSGHGPPSNLIVRRSRSATGTHVTPVSMEVKGYRQYKPDSTCTRGQTDMQAMLSINGAGKCSAQGRKSSVDAALRPWPASTSTFQQHPGSACQPLNVSATSSFTISAPQPFTNIQLYHLRPSTFQHHPASPFQPLNLSPTSSFTISAPQRFGNVQLPISTPSVVQQRSSPNPL